MLTASPQLEPGGDWDVVKLDRLLADLRKRYRIDDARLCLTGLSLGRIATWRWALAHPGLFAAIAPVAAGTPIEEACKIKNLPIRAFHDYGEVPVRGNVDMVHAVRACAGAVKPRLTVYPLPTISRAHLPATTRHCAAGSANSGADPSASPAPDTPDASARTAGCRIVR